MRWLLTFAVGFIRELHKAKPTITLYVPRLEDSEWKQWAE